MAKKWLREPERTREKHIEKEGRPGLYLNQCWHVRVFVPRYAKPEIG
jgi:hypothetical protein